jgi:hypothetical protein
VPGDWVDLDLSDAVNRLVAPGDPYGEYSGGFLRSVDGVGSGRGVKFYFPGLVFGTDLDYATSYDFEITFDATATWTYCYVTAHATSDDASYLSGPVSYLVDDVGDDGPPPSVFEFTVGPGLFDWDAAVTAGYVGMTFEATNSAVISGLRFRTSDGAPAAAANRDDGFDLDGASPVRWVPAMVSTPARLAGEMSYDKARAYTSVTLGPGPKDASFVGDIVARSPRARDRILVGGVDITYLNGVRTPTPDFTLIQPLLYGSGSMSIPQLNPYFGSRPAWLRKFAEVEVQRVLDDEVVATDYVGFIAELSIQDGTWQITLGGQAAGRLSADGYWPPSPFTRKHDAGFLLIDLLRSHGVTAKPENGPNLNVPMKRRGGSDALTLFNEILNTASTNANGPLDCYPNFNGVYRIHEKDLETVDATVYFDAEFVTPSLGVSFLEDTDVVFATGRTPNGELVNFIVAPGAVQGDPPDDAPTFPFGPGDVDADTSTGDGVSVAQQQLSATPFLNIANVELGTYDDVTADAVAALQDQAGLLIAPEFVGHMTEATWNAMWNLDAIGFSLDQARQIPAAQRGYVPKWNLSANGSKLGRNRDYIPASLRPRVVRGIDVGAGHSRHRIQKFARSQLAPINQTNWAGTASLVSGLVRGEHTPGDTITADDVMSGRELRPGMNVWAPLFDGGTLFHVSGLSVSDDGKTVTPILDVQARSSVPAWESINSRRESRSNPAREWGGALRSSTIRNDNVNDWSDVSGMLGNKVTLEAGKWTGFPIFSGQTGVLQQVRAEVVPAREFAIMVAGKRFKVGRLNRRIPDPLADPSGDRPWYESEALAKYLRDHKVLYGEGTFQNPCGYGASLKTADGVATAAPLTGIHHDLAGGDYDASFTGFALWVYVWVDAETVVQPGRMLWQQLTAGA